MLSAKFTPNTQRNASEANKYVEIRHPDPQNSLWIHRPLVMWCERYVGKEPYATCILRTFGEFSFYELR
jgi:hypothetical protein